MISDQLPGLEGLPAVIQQVLSALKQDPRYRNLPEGCNWADLENDFSDPRNWYLAGSGHVTPSFHECLSFAKGYIDGHRY